MRIETRYGQITYDPFRRPCILVAASKRGERTLKIRVDDDVDLAVSLLLDWLDPWSRREAEESLAHRFQWQKPL